MLIKQSLMIKMVTDLESSWFTSIYGLDIDDIRDCLSWSCTALRWSQIEVCDAQWPIDMQIAISFVIRHSVTKKVVEVRRCEWQVRAREKRHTVCDGVYPRRVRF